METSIVLQILRDAMIDWFNGSSKRKQWLIENTYYIDDNNPNLHIFLYGLAPGGRPSSNIVGPPPNEGKVFKFTFNSEGVGQRMEAAQSFDIEFFYEDLKIEYAQPLSWFAALGLLNALLQSPNYYETNYAKGHDITDQSIDEYLENELLFR